MSETYIDDDIIENSNENNIGDIPNSPLAELRRELSKVAVNEPITLKVPNRPTISLRFDTNIDAQMIELWQRRSQRRVANQVRQDGVKFAALVIANQCQCVLFHGEDQQNSQGLDLNFRGPDLKEMLGLPSEATATQVVKALYGSDGSILTAADAVTVAGGYGNEADVEEDDETPTQES